MRTSKIKIAIGTPKWLTGSVKGVFGRSFQLLLNKFFIQGAVLLEKVVMEKKESVGEKKKRMVKIAVH